MSTALNWLFTICTYPDFSLIVRRGILSGLPEIFENSVDTGRLRLRTRTTYLACQFLWLYFYISGHYSYLNAAHNVPSQSGSKLQDVRKREVGCVEHHVVTHQERLLFQFDVFVCHQTYAEWWNIEFANVTRDEVGHRYTTAVRCQFRQSEQSSVEIWVNLMMISYNWIFVEYHQNNNKNIINCFLQSNMSGSYLNKTLPIEVIPIVVSIFLSL